ncbi:hypothetical protein Hanom_Chr05g00418841 [Helianthus anomalus]
MADLEPKKNNKLHSCHASSYILEQIFNIKPDDNDSEKNKKGISSEIIRFHRCLRKSLHFMMTRRWQKLSTWLINCQITLMTLPPNLMMLIIQRW